MSTTPPDTEDHSSHSSEQQSSNEQSTVPTNQPMEDKTAPTSSTPYNPQDPLETFDWEDLEARYHAKMAHCEAAEGEIYKEFEEWLKIFEIWMSTTCVYENDRSYKRLRTRMGYVQGAETRLEEKRQHHVNVVKAFESALALLSGP